MKKSMFFFIILIGITLVTVSTGTPTADAATWHDGIPKTLNGTWDGCTLKLNIKQPDGRHVKYYSQVRFSFYNKTFASSTNLNFNLRQKLQFPQEIKSIAYEGLHYKNIKMGTYLIRGNISNGDDFTSQNNHALSIQVKILSKNKFTVSTIINNKKFNQPFYRVK